MLFGLETEVSRKIADDSPAQLPADEEDALLSALPRDRQDKAAGEDLEMNDAIFLDDGEQRGKPDANFEMNDATLFGGEEILPPHHNVSKRQRHTECYRKD
jgi:hypothetical protein